LEASSNPFATIVMAHLKTKATTGKLPQREQWKWKLIRGLYEKEFEREQIIKLFEIIDNMMTLSTELQSSLESKIKQFEKETRMPYITSVERLGMQREGANLVLRQLNRRFGQVTTSVEKQIRQLSVKQLEDLGEALLDFENEADLLHWLSQNHD
jgi:ribosomal protein S13